MREQVSSLAFCSDWCGAIWQKARPDTVTFRRFVESGRDLPAQWESLRNQIFLGTDAFVDRMRERIKALEGSLWDVPSAQRRGPVKELAAYESAWTARCEAIVAAYRSGGYTLQEIGAYFGLHYSRVSRIVRHKPHQTAAAEKGKT